MGLFGKSSDDRLNDTVDYLKAKLPDNADEVSHKLFQEMSSSEQKRLSESLSLGATGSKADRKRDHDPRRAKRALMLVTALFLKDQAMRDAEMARVKLLPETSEDQFLKELRSWFIIPAVTGAAVASDAEANIALMPNWNNLQIKSHLAVRGEYKKGAEYQFNCYNAVVFWAFQAGAISRRWLFNYWEGKDGNAAFPIFSKCQWITDIKYELGKPPKLVRDVFNGGPCQIPRGLAVYFVTPYKVFGHVALSLGNGMIISQNSVNPAFKDKIEPGTAQAVAKMERAETHILSIRQFWDIHYNPGNGYNKLQHTMTPFWEAYPSEER